MVPSARALFIRPAASRRHAYSIHSARIGAYEQGARGWHHWCEPGSIVCILVDPPRIGVDFAGYRIESMAGRGGASVVYRAVYLQLGNDVALKVLAPEFSEMTRFS